MKSSKIIGSISGVIILFLGFSIAANTMIYGADFYTDIYKLVQRGFSFLLIAIGLTDIAVFASLNTNTPKTEEDNDDALPQI